MKIVYISSSEIPSRTANSVHVMKMCSAFSKYVETILFAIKGESKINPYEYYESRRDFDLITVKKAKNFFGSIGYIFKVLSLLEIDKNTLIYGRHRLVIFLLSLRNTNIVYESHEIPIGRVRGWIEGLIFKQKGFEKLIVISNALKSDYLHFFSNLSDHDIVVAHDGADVPSNNRIINSKKDILKVGYVGHLFQGRGIEIIIQLARIFPDICFEVVGGMDRDVKFWKKKVSRITNIKFYGHIAHKDLSKFYHSFDILLAPYQTGVNQEDGKSDTSKWMSPMKVFEYMSYGKPIISSDIPVLREVLNENNCILVNPSDIEAWSLAIKLLRSQEKRELLGEMAYKDFCSYYTWDSRAKNILSEINILSKL